jgi:uncharacterized membrane protein
MTTQNGSALKQFRFELGVLAPILIVAGLLAFFPPDGNERAEWMQFIGRFHPLVIHFPIALFLLVPVLELAGRNSRLAYLRLSANFVLLLATLGAITAAILGWCLGRSGGYTGSLVIQHMWGGVLLSFVCWTCWLLRTRLRELGMAYAVMLVLGVGLVSWTGYRGGQLSLGADHLTEHMPPELRNLLRIEDKVSASNIDPNTFYGGRVQPIFAHRCVSCHSAGKRKGNLRLDSYAGLLRGGKHGPVVRAGNVQASELFRRITLATSHDDFMPKGKSPLSADQVKTIELWIGAGASETLAIDAIKGAPSDSVTSAVTEVKFEEPDPSAIARLRSSIEPIVSQLQKQFPNILNYESRGSADLILNSSLLGSKFSDRDLQAFAPVAEHITIADLSRTAITDQSAGVIAAMKRLRVLRLPDTHITDATLSRLDALSQLESLNVYGTPVTPAVLPNLAKLPKLAHCYVGQTGIQSGKSVPESLVSKLVF